MSLQGVCFLPRAERLFGEAAQLRIIVSLAIPSTNNNRPERQENVPELKRLNKRRISMFDPYSVLLNNMVATVIITAAEMVRKARSPRIATKPASFSSSAFNPCTE